MAKSQKKNLTVNDKPQPVAKSANKGKTIKTKENPIVVKEIKEVIKSSKQEILIALLERPSGATIDEMMKATGWQRHSIHGLMSGVLRKKLKLTITSEQQERGRVYIISNKIDRL